MTSSSRARRADEKPAVSGLMMFLLDAEAVEARRGAGEEIGFFRCRGAACEPLERIEQDGIAAGALVDREIALEHAAVGAETLDAAFDIGPPGIRELARGRRQRREV